MSPRRKETLRYRDARVAQDYDRLREAGWVRRRREAMQRKLLAKGLVGLAPGSTVLDLPCGTGRFTPWLVARGYQALGADLSPDMLAVAQSKLGSKGLGLFVGDAARLPFADRSLDAVLMVRFLHLVTDAERVPLFRELSRVVRERVVLQVAIKSWSVKRMLRRVRRVPLKPLKLQWTPLLEQLSAGGLEVERIHRKLPFASTSAVIVCRPVHSQGANPARNSAKNSP